MQVDRDATTKKHFEMVTMLTNRLSKNNLSFFNHSYNYLCFGNWEIIIGSGHKERKFLWDGRDFFLIVSDRIKNNLTQGGQWKIVYELPVGEVSEEDLFEKVYQIAIEIK